MATLGLESASGIRHYLDMYLRHTLRRKDGKTHKYWQLVIFVRIGKKVRQEMVAHLGEPDVQDRMTIVNFAFVLPLYKTSY